MEKECIKVVVVIRKSCKKKKTNYWGEGMYRSGEEIKKKGFNATTFFNKL